MLMTKESLEKYISAIDNKQCGIMHGSEKDQDGGLMMPFAHYDPIIRELEQEFFESDLVDYQYGDTALALIDSLPAKLDILNRKEIGTCITFIFRGERFCEGHILSYLENGLLVALLRRLLNIEYKS